MSDDMKHIILANMNVMLIVDRLRFATYLRGGDSFFPQIRFDAK